MDFEEVESELTPEGRALLIQMVDAHLDTPAAEDRAFIWLGSVGGDSLVAPNDADLTAPVSHSILHDLVELGLLRPDFSRTNDSYEVRAPAVRFVEWLRSRDGAVAAAEREALRLIDDNILGEDLKHHLSEALQLVWLDESTNTPIVIEIGQHLRSALQQACVAGVGGNAEKAPSGVGKWFEQVLGERDGPLLANTVRWCLECCNRLMHIVDEAAKGRPLRGREELRRVAFLTITVCVEVASVDAPK